MRKTLEGKEVDEEPPGPTEEGGWGGRRFGRKLEDWV